MRPDYSERHERPFRHSGRGGEDLRSGSGRDKEAREDMLAEMRSIVEEYIDASWDDLYESGCVDDREEEQRKQSFTQCKRKLKKISGQRNKRKVMDILLEMPLGSSLREMQKAIEVVDTVISNQSQCEGTFGSIKYTTPEHIVQQFIGEELSMYEELFMYDLMIKLRNKTSDVIRDMKYMQEYDLRSAKTDTDKEHVARFGTHFLKRLYSLRSLWMEIVRRLDMSDDSRQDVIYELDLQYQQLKRQWGLFEKNGYDGYADLAKIAIVVGMRGGETGWDGIMKRLLRKFEGQQVIYNGSRELGSWIDRLLRIDLLDDEVREPKDLVERLKAGGSIDYTLVSWGSEPYRLTRDNDEKSTIGIAFKLKEDIDTVVRGIEHIKNSQERDKFNKYSFIHSLYDMRSDWFVLFDRLNNYKANNVGEVFYRKFKHTIDDSLEDDEEKWLNWYYDQCEYIEENRDNIISYMTEQYDEFKSAWLGLSDYSNIYNNSSENIDQSEIKGVILKLYTDMYNIAVIVGMVGADGWSGHMENYYKNYRNKS